MSAEWWPRWQVSGCCRPLCVIMTRLHLYMVHILARIFIYTYIFKYTYFCVCFTRRMLEWEHEWGLNGGCTDLRA